MISIAMATYNGEKYLPLQIDSILNQSIQDFEIIICDDCSTDSTWNILQDYSKRDGRIKCYRNETNLGFKRNFERAISLCSGEYIALSDQDDIWKENHLQLLYSQIENADIACGNAEIIDEFGDYHGQKLNEIDFLFSFPGSEKVPYRILYNSGCFQGASMLLRKSFVEVALPIPDKVNYHDTWFALLASLRNGFTYTFEVITLHRRHSSNASKNTKWKKLFGFLYYRRVPTRKDRVEMAEQALFRLENQLTKSQKKILKHVSVYANKKRPFAKTNNLIFRMFHYQGIYTAGKKLFLEW